MNTSNLTIEQLEELMPIGTPVRYYPFANSTEYFQTTTRSLPWDLDGVFVVQIKGRTGFILVSHIFTINEHNWKHAPDGSDAFWKCFNCNKLDFNAIPDMSPTCMGNIRSKIEAEIEVNKQ